MDEDITNEMLAINGKLAFSQDGTHLAIVTLPKVRIYNVISGSLTEEFLHEIHLSTPKTLQFNQDMSRLHAGFNTGGRGVPSFWSWELGLNH